ncbi:MAG: hypothetical protein ACTSV7_13430 [Candidatus Baldrarchaeia archaeon]
MSWRAFCGRGCGLTRAYGKAEAKLKKIASLNREYYLLPIFT